MSTKGTNKRRHVDKVWGENGTAYIKIPTLIDDHSYWMGGVDISDQYMSYYHPFNIVCQCTWISMFLQLLSFI
eukprot:6398165-Ditylum_brightwellii.AAC.1